MKVVIVLDTDAIRRADTMDPKQFVESLKMAALGSTGPRTVYASGMVAGNVVWRGPRNENPTLRVDGTRADVLDEGKPF